MLTLSASALARVQYTVRAAIQHDHRLGGRDDQQCHAKVAAVVPGAGSLHMDTPEQFAGALDALAGGWTIGAADAFAAAPLVIDRIGGVA
jgi:hypothetical protein